MLGKRLPAAKLTMCRLGDAIDFLRDVAGVNINVDWKALAVDQHFQGTQINLNLHDVSAGKSAVADSVSRRGRGIC